MKQPATGFTLIELLIVIAIIGILASISVPYYRDYLAKSQTLDCMGLLRSAKARIEEQLIFSGDGPDSLEELENLGAKIEGSYCNLDAVETNNDGSSLVTAKMGIQSSQTVRGKTVEFARNAYEAATDPSAWICRSGTTNGLDDKFLPRACH